MSMIRSLIIINLQEDEAFLVSEVNLATSITMATGCLIGSIKKESRDFDREMKTAVS